MVNWFSRSLITKRFVFVLCFLRAMNIMFPSEKGKPRTKKLALVITVKCLKFKTDQAQDAKKMEKLNNIFFALMARGPDVNISEITGKEQMEAQPAKKGRGRKQ
ncbi:signal recognition particle 9 kDa protein isoform X2 [Pistacia vera]|uniref:signal recognition particle 9 kDa protein isoform X2 n=1 Tax=Pistacia vera TaxID=55513 RepID=UPI0012630790|nr:signal recognition particle 9 kDa protein isoform X2 [Pistacia vera]